MKAFISHSWFLFTFFLYLCDSYSVSFYRHVVTKVKVPTDDLLHIYRDNYICCNRDFKYHFYYNKHMFLAHGLKTNVRVKPEQGLLLGQIRALRVCNRLPFTYFPAIKTSIHIIAYRNKRNDVPAVSRSSPPGTSRSSTCFRAGDRTRSQRPEVLGTAGSQKLPIRRRALKELEVHPLFLSRRLKPPTRSSTSTTTIRTRTRICKSWKWCRGEDVVADGKNVVGLGLMLATHARK